MIKFDFTKHSVEDLIELNHRLIKHVKAARRASAFDTMMQFSIGQKVRSKWSVRPQRLAGLEGTIVDILRTRIKVRTSIGDVRFTPNAIEPMSVAKSKAKK